MNIIEYLEVGVQTLAMAHAGILEFDCSTCKDEIAIDLNCNQQDRGNSVFFDVIRMLEFESCPISLIPKQVYQWYDRYSYNKEFGMSVDYDSCISLYWWFCKTYNRYYNEYIEIKHNRKD